MAHESGVFGEKILRHPLLQLVHPFDCEVGDVVVPQTLLLYLLINNLVKFLELVAVEFVESYHLLGVQS